ncbi:glycine cleavage system protein T, partial [Brevibacterium paucivorans]
TGYTGEDGFELYIKNADAEALWNRLMSINEAEFDGAALPCG